MMDEAEKLIKGSVHEEDLFIVHNYLVVIIAKETINWMRQTVTYIDGCLPSMD